MADRVGYGIDWGEDHVRVVVLEKKGPICRVAQILGVDGVSTEEAPAKLAKVLKEAGVSPRRSVVGVAGAGVLLRYVRLPRLDDEKLRRLVKMEIEEFTSRSEGTFVHDYGILNVPTREVDRFLMLVAMAKDEELQATFDRLRRGRVGTRAAVPSPIALYDAYVKFGSLDAKGVVALVDLAPRALHIVLVKENTLWFARSLSGGLNLFLDAVASSRKCSAADALRKIQEDGDITPGARGDHDLSAAMLGAAGQVLNMIESSVKFAKAQIGVPNLDVGRVYLAGEAPRVRGLTEYLMKSLQRSVVPFRPEADLELAAGTSVSDLAGYEVALGLAQMALDDGAYRLSLVPVKEKKRQEFLRETLYQYLAMAAMVLFLAGAIVIKAGRAGDFEEGAKALGAAKVRGDQLGTRLEEASVAAGAAEERLRVLEARVRPGSEFRRLLTILKEETPEHVFVTRVDYARPRGEASSAVVFSVKGYVEEFQSDVQGVKDDYAAALARHPQLARCDLIASRPDAEKGVLEFDLEIAFKPGAGRVEE